MASEVPFTDAENEGIDNVYDEGRYIVSDEQKWLTQCQCLIQYALHVINF